MVLNHVPVISLLCMITGSVTNSSIKPKKSGINLECLHNGFCESVEGYPSELARRLITELKAKNVIFPNEEQASHPQPVDFSMRFGDDYDSAVSNEYELQEDSESLCKSEVTFKSPKLAEDINKKLRFIINDEKNPVQTFRYEICKSKRCSDKITFLPNYRAECHQTFTLKEMFYISKDNTSSIEYFKVPTCCSCKTTSL